MTKKICVIILLSSLMLVNGCNFNSTETTSKGEEKNSAIQQQSSNQSEPSSQVNQQEFLNELSTNKDQFIVNNSDKDNGWKELTAKVSLNEMIYDGDSRGSTNLAGDRMVEYSIHFPATWTLSNTVFEDSNNNKVAEIAPVVLLKQRRKQSF